MIKMINARRHLDFPLLYTSTKRACQSFPYDTTKSIDIRLRNNINNNICVLYLCIRLGPRAKKIKNGNPESSKVCYSINLKKYIWCIRNHCIVNFSE